MNPILIRQVWAAIEGMQTTNLCSLDDRTLIDNLLGVVGRKQALDYGEKQAINRYLRAKLPLVRDIGDARLSDERKK
ncbi:MAG: hypothetical protein SWY16_12460 [Cyanobacteriota bacterium]|nr:hypothetical protein [Cyanobacteriota bacterium]